MGAALADKEVAEQLAEHWALHNLIFPYKTSSNGRTRPMN